MLAVAGCAQLPTLGLGQKPEPVAQPLPEETGEPLSAVPEGEVIISPPSETPMTTAGQSAAALDTVSESEKEEAKAAAAQSGAQELGRTTASLGAPAEAGLWLKTPLVSAPAKGKVELASGGESLAVDLIPIEGEATAGSRLSLSAMQALGVSLTDLPELVVYRLN